MRIGLALSIVTLVYAGGCLEDDDVDLDWACSNVASPTHTDHLTRELEIGEVKDGVFTPWHDGQAVALVTGLQGSSMLVPWLELPAEPGDQDGSCWRVRYDHLDDAGADEGRGALELNFSLEDGVMRGGPIYDIFYGGEGELVRVRAVIEHPDFTATDEVEIRPITP